MKVTTINIAKEVLQRPTFLSQESLDQFTTKALADSSPDDPEDDEDVEAEAEEYKTIEDYYRVFGNLCVVLISGVLMKDRQPDESDCDYTDITMISSILDMAKNDPSISTVWLLVNSPGGFAQGISALADQVYELDQVKPCLCYVNGQNASACFWVTSQCRGIYTSADSVGGSIGAFKTILNRTKQLEMQGLQLEVYSMGEDKGMESPFLNRTDEQKAFILSEQVGKPYQEFANAVTRKRPQIDLKEVKARVWNADSMVLNGLSDGIYKTFSDAVNDKTPITYQAV